MVPTVHLDTPKKAQTAPAGFTRIKCSGREPLFFKRIMADHPASMKILGDNSLIPIQDPLAYAPELIAKFGDEGAWFWGSEKDPKNQEDLKIRI